VTTTEDAEDRRTNPVAFTVDGARGSLSNLEAQD